MSFARIDPAAAVVTIGIVGARILFLVEHGELLQPSRWLGTFGFSINGAVILGPLAGAAYMRWRGLGMRYLDALAAGFPAGLVVGRVGDLINGEHFGPPSELPWAIRYTHPEALTPSPEVAYHPGGLYEMVLGLAMLALIWPLRHRFRHPGMLLWAVIGLYSAGRFVMFFYRSDSEQLALGLNGAQWTSIVLLAAVALAAYLTARATPGRERRADLAPRRAP